MNTKLGRNPFQARSQSPAQKQSPGTLTAEPTSTGTVTDHAAAKTSQARRSNKPLPPAGQLAEGLSEMHPLVRWALVDLGADAYMTALKGVLLIGGALRR